MALLAIVYKCQLRQKVSKINFISSRLILPRNYTVYKQYAIVIIHIWLDGAKFPTEQFSHLW